MLDSVSKRPKAPPVAVARGDCGRIGSPSPRTPNCDDWAATAAGPIRSSQRHEPGESTDHGFPGRDGNA